jgi:hypothetical protein
MKQMKRMKKVSKRVLALATKYAKARAERAAKAPKKARVVKRTWGRTPTDEEHEEHGPITERHWGPMPHPRTAGLGKEWVLTSHGWERMKKGRLPQPKRHNQRDPSESIEAHELILYMDNDAELYRRKDAYLKNMHTKMKRGKFDPALAPKLWMYYVELGAKKYVKEFGGGKWNVIFPKAAREEVARHYASHEARMIQAGEYHAYPPVAAYTRHDPGWHGHPRLHAKAAKLGARRAGKRVKRRVGKR